ncbi:MAG: hypothetical protein ACREI9_00165 [Nitrospiraceae bacterium]
MSSADLPRPLLPLLALSLAACAHTIDLVNLKDGSTLSGRHSLWQHSLTVTLPTGETSTGTYTKLTTADIGEGSLFFGANAGELLGRHTAEQIYGYARLTGKGGIVMEIIFASDWLGHGYGVARTSLKEEYRVTF